MMQEIATFLHQMHTNEPHPSYGKKDKGLLDSFREEGEQLP